MQLNKSENFPRKWTNESSVKLLGGLPFEVVAIGRPMISHMFLFN